MFEIEFFSDNRNNEPIRVLLEELATKAETSKTDRIRLDKILLYIRLLQKHGSMAGEPYVKHIEGKIWELRPLKDRIFFFTFENKTIVLLHHFTKKTQKTPQSEIEQGKRNMQIHINKQKRN